MRSKRICFPIIAVGMIFLLFSSCASTKYVPDGSYLLDEVKINVKENVSSESDLMQYLRQRPNFKAFGLFRIYMGVYNLSGRDTSKRINRKLKSIGEAPVIYDPYLTFQSEKELQKKMKQKGYMDAQVTSSVEFRKKKAKVTYDITPNKPYIIGEIKNNFNIDSKIDSIMKERGGWTNSKIKTNNLFDIDVLDDERERIATYLRRRGYYNFSRENISFLADSSIGNHKIDLSIQLKPLTKSLGNGNTETIEYKPYKIRHINITTYNGSSTDASNVSDLDTIEHNPNITIFSNGKPLLRPSILEEDLRITPNSTYNEFIVERAYSRYNNLGILRSSSIRFNEVEENGNELDCDIALFSGKPQSISFDIEGTNSNGDLGFALNLGYAHKNIFRGSEVLNINARYAQEAYSGLSNILREYVLDFGGDVSINFPRFLFPFVSTNFKRRIDANTEFKILYNYQIRPNTYERTTISTGMKYIWNHRRFYRYAFDFIDLNYINIDTDPSFDSIYSASKYSVLRESYSDHFIMSSKFTITYDDRSINTNSHQHYYRVSLETAGNTLFAINSLFGGKKNSDGQYEIGKIPYSQFVKGEFDYSYNQYFDAKNRLVYHIGFGLSLPYGNGSVVPFEKRFFGGGANGVRGWSVRTLGPGSYSSDRHDDFVKQSGDIKLLLNLEYRTKLFWKIEAAAFIDAGNIWTIKDYESQPLGQFRFKDFYKQIALAYGLGLRLDFSYFLIRFDMGVKAYNPSRISSEKWRFKGINWDDDFALHFAIGYPF